MKYLLRNKNFWIILGIDMGLVCASTCWPISSASKAASRRNRGAVRKDAALDRGPEDPRSSRGSACIGACGATQASPISINIIKADVISAGAIALALLLVRRFEGFSRSVLILDALITLMLIGGIRLLIRVLHPEDHPGELLSTPPSFPFSTPTRRSGRGCSSSGQAMPVRRCCGRFMATPGQVPAVRPSR